MELLTYKFHFKIDKLLNDKGHQFLLKQSLLIVLFSLVIFLFLLLCIAWLASLFMCSESIESEIHQRDIVGVQSSHIYKTQKIRNSSQFKIKF
jgi:hypothetical protein